MHYLCRKCAKRLSSPEDLAEHDTQAHTEQVSEPVKITIDEGDDFIPLDKCDDKITALLKAKGLNTYQKLIDSSEKDLTAIKGIGKATAQAIQISAKELLDASDEQGLDTTDEETQEDT